jgi:hypothetical protein
MGKLIVNGDFSRQGETPILSAAAILRTLVQKYSSTLLNTRTSRKLGHTSAVNYFWTYDKWEFFAHLCEYYTPLAPYYFF